VANPQEKPASLAQIQSLLRALLVDGLKHGHFEYTLKCEVTNGGKRCLVVQAGKSHRFLIAVEDIDT